MTNIGNYYHGTGRFNKEFTELCALVPATGNCPTLQGELIRAVNRIGYDYWNNGFGNNTSGAMNFLMLFLPATGEDHALLRKLKRRLLPYLNSADFVEVDMEDEVNQLVDLVTRVVMDMGEPIPNTRDIFDFQDDDVY